MVLSGLREKVILTKNVTNGCVKGDTECLRGGLAPPLCRTMLTSAIGVIQAVWPTVPCIAEERGVGPMLGATEG